MKKLTPREIEEAQAEHGPCLFRAALLDANERLSQALGEIDRLKAELAKERGSTAALKSDIKEAYQERQEYKNEADFLRDKAGPAYQRGLEDGAKRMENGRVKAEAALAAMKEDRDRGLYLHSVACPSCRETRESLALAEGVVKAARVVDERADYDAEQGYVYEADMLLGSALAAYDAARAKEKPDGR